MEEQRVGLVLKELEPCLERLHTGAVAFEICRDMQKGGAAMDESWWPGLRAFCRM